MLMNNMVTCTFAEFESRNLTLKKMRRKQWTALRFPFDFLLSLYEASLAEKKRKKTTLLLVVSIAYDSDAKHGT